MALWENQRGLLIKDQRGSEAVKPKRIYGE